MCARPRTLLASIGAIVLTLSACTSPDRTGTTFCQQLSNETPAIGQPITTTMEIRAMVARYERLLERAPLTIEGDLAVLTDLLRQAARVNPTNETDVQQLADASYAANKSSLAVRDWIMSTCAVDISTGLGFEPPRVATTLAPEPSPTPAPSLAPTPAPAP